MNIYLFAKFLTAFNMILNYMIQSLIQKNEKVSLKNQVR